MNLEWIRALGLAAATGAVPAAAASATAMAGDGFTLKEVHVILAVTIAGALTGMVTLFQKPPRDPERRERRVDRVPLDRLVDKIAAVDEHAKRALVSTNQGNAPSGQRVGDPPTPKSLKFP